MATATPSGGGERERIPLPTYAEVKIELEQTPHILAKAPFEALQAKYPWKFTDGQLRTFQRRVKEW